MENGEEADKIKEIARSSNQKCKVYKSFNIISIVLENEATIARGSTRRCYVCWGEQCREPYTGKTHHEFNCWPGFDHCMKTEFDRGKWLHN